jgi:cell wall-associated NlpC family hydrolase
VGRTDARRQPRHPKELLLRPLHPGRTAVATLVALGLLTGIGRPAQAALRASALAIAGGRLGPPLMPLRPLESPAQRIARLRSQAAKVQHTIDQMNNQVEVLVERYNANREALARTQTAQTSTQHRIEQAKRELTDAKHQEGVVQSESSTLARIERAKRALDAPAAQLAAQRSAQESLRVNLERDRQQIEQQLSSQRAYLAHLAAAVRQAVEEERRRPEELRRQALARRLAALRAARLRAERAAAAQRASASHLHSSPAGAGSAASASTVAGRAVAFAMSQLGKPYEWGATGPGSYDCSGLTQTAYRYAGLAIPRVSADQWNVGPHVSMGELRAGDLVFFATSLSDPGSIHHVGMYIGRGLMVEAPFTGANVRVSSVGRADCFGATRPTG